MSFKSGAILRCLLAVAFTAVLLILSSCISDPLPAKVGNTQQCTFALELPDAPEVITRGVTGSVVENYISELTILLFDAGTKMFVGKVPATGLTASGTNNNKWAVQAEMSTGTYDLVALANLSSYVDFSSVSAGSKDDILAQLSITSNTRWNPATTKPIPMWGEISNVAISSSAVPANTVFYMTRMMAKINLTVGSSVGFTLSSIRYYNYSTKGYAVPDPGNVTGSGTNLEVTAPTIYNNDSGTMTGSYLTYSGTSDITSSKSCTNKIYVFEAAQVADYPATADGWSSTTDWQNNPCLVIGGKYGTDTGDTYYRIDFIKKGGTAADDEPLALIRNHIYQVNINSVKGSGYADPGKAYSSAPMNVDYSTYTWTEPYKGAATTDGPYIMSVSETELMTAYSQAPGTPFNLTLKTSYTGGWSAVMYNDAACTTPMTGGWMTVSPSSGTGVTDGTNVTITLAGKTVGSRYIKFTSGRMSLVVKVSCSIALDFARSNIVQNSSTTLAFAVSERDNVSIPANVQGLHFRFGSLVGISSTGANETAWASARATFRPSEYSGPTTFTWTYTGGNDNANNIPYCKGTHEVHDDYFDPNLWSSWTDKTKRYVASSAIGDICSYISDKGWVSGTWRTPTRHELQMLWSETNVLTNNGVDRGIKYGTPALGSISTTYGKEELVTGVWIGAGINAGAPMTSYDAKMPPRGVVFIPAGGYRNGSEASGESSSRVGLFKFPRLTGFLWSSSSRVSKTNGSAGVTTDKAKKAYCLNTYGGSGAWEPYDSEFVRGDAMPVRCIRVQ